MLNCTVTYRCTDKKPCGNTLEKPKSVTQSIFDDITGGDSMTSLHTDKNFVATHESLIDGVLRRDRVPVTSKVTAFKPGEHLDFFGSGDIHAPLPGNRHRSPG